ncbi:hypothetical protein GCM10011521_16410 [Arenimonas soli]|uniref:DUF4345 domain-containing protein n=1 Tax=Arenimonas soli TaxID=2269504 RepID=A0ABQ1HI53_9GAMM|nr:hypothetical protein [Arenimonas soli]GGA78912.1 hypothetical protein GCM10011521_16410 [Arenimonas soli]
MTQAVPLAVVALAALFFITLGAASLVAPAGASRFLLGFAGSPGKHYAELAIRFVVGGAFLLAAPYVLWPGAFSVFGWVLVATTAVLLLIPWRWHHRFARHAVPEALRFLPLVGVASVVLGGLVLWAVLRGHAAWAIIQAGAGGGA